MSVPDIQIFSSILTSPVADPFILDSATFGLLDTDVLGGFVEVPLDVPIRSITISRGRSRQLDRYTAGTASIVFNNFDRRLDPLNEDSDLFGQIVPRQRIEILANGIDIFTGVVSDWDIEYDITNWDVAVASAADAFTVLSNFVFDTAVTPVAETSADRLDWVLEEFGYQGGSSFLGGPSTLGAYQVESGTQALDYMFSVAKSAQSSFFVDADGVLRLIGIFDKVPTSAVTFADDGSGVHYSSLQNQYGDELLYNRVVASSPAGLAVVEDSASIAQFEVSTVDLSGLLLNSTVQLISVANSYLNLYSVPQVRFTGLSVELAGLSVEDTNAILALDLTDQVTVVKSFNVGSPLQVSQDLMITGIKHQIRPDSYVVEFSFDPSEFREAFRLDDAVYGILDGDYVLG
jgi:hypothetical protein